MTPLLIAVIAAVAVALTIHSARRALAERNAVERHHRTLDVLGTLAERAERAEVAAPSAPVAAPYQPRHRRSRSTRRRVSPFAAVGILGAVLVAVAAGWYLAARQPGGASPAQRQPPAKQAPTVAPSTTLANRTPVVLLSSDDQQARYRLQSPSVQVELVATGACWVEIKSGLGQGPVVFSGTLRPGARRAIPTTAASGGVSIRLGNPAGMSVSVDGSVLPVPRPTGTKPFTLLFQPAG
ncbi:MAG: hypothetical protein QOK39_531 [Acidimicrobiaceae bacterium]|jgi:hypothetical protein|nr:hypothetical protein [Acidimicrobiaceae bacterium]MDQ1427055.1 hypothetical protein [Acidimicrobiaceae bacterium]